MIGKALIAPLAELAGGWLEGRKARQAASAKLALAEAEARAEVLMAAAKSEAAWESVMAANSGTSWKDEALLIVFCIPLVLAFIGDGGRVAVARGFESLSHAPDWYFYALGVIVAGSYGLRGAAKIIGRAGPVTGIAAPNAARLATARGAPKDEYYTPIGMIAAEARHYDWTGKHVHCPCDDPGKSQFVAYFRDNFERLGLRRLTASHHRVPSLDRPWTPPARFEKTRDGETTGTLRGDGDFRGREVRDLMAAADVVVTNPPFSLFRAFAAQLADDGLDFLLIANNLAASYKDFMGQIIAGRVRLGVTCRNGDSAFHIPAGYKATGTLDGRPTARIGVHWFTTLHHGFGPPPLSLEARYSPEAYPRLDNADAINVDKRGDIPGDYDGVMAVPNAFLAIWNSAQFDVVGRVPVPIIRGKPIFKRITIRRRAA